MHLSTKDFELLKLICWCRNIPSPAGINPFSFYNAKEISALEQMGLAYTSRDGKSIRPRIAAYRLLKDAGYEFTSDIKPQTKEKTVTRRNIASKILFTFYAAGISVFNDRIADTIDNPVYLASFAARRGSSNNPFGSTRFYGIYCTTQEAFLVLYADEIGVYYKKELTLFHNLTEIVGIKNTAIIFMGDSTSGIGTHVVTAKKMNTAKKKYSTDTFAQVFDTTPLPIHFIPVGDAGAQILRFLLIPNYREVIAKAALKKSYSPPYEGLTDTDTIHFAKPNNPAVVAVDMDVNRIDRAVAAAQKEGFEKITIYALKEQLPFLRSRYANTGNADVMEIFVHLIKKELDFNIDLYTPPSNQYFTSDGRCFDAANLSDYRKTGKPNRQEGGPLSEP